VKTFFVYILASRSLVLYIGVTNDLQRRIYEHKTKIFQGFTEKYDVNRLIYFETFGEIEQAIHREKQLKGWNRTKKLMLVKTTNPDLSKGDRVRMKFLSIRKRSFDSATIRSANGCSALDIFVFIGFVALILFILNSSLFVSNVQAQTASRYDFYRYLQQYAVEIDPLGDILGRMSAQIEERLDPNFSRVYEIVYQRDLADQHNTGWYPESGVTIAAIERIFLTDNAALLGQYVGVGVGAGIVNETIAVRITAEIGYKIAFGGGTGHFFIEPRVLMDSYIVTNRDGQRILPYIALPFGYSWW
jgi:putative endonuclease